MSELDYFRGQWESFREWEQAEHLEIKDQLKELTEKVDHLRLWRASMLGASAVVGSITGFITAWVTR